MFKSYKHLALIASLGVILGGCNGGDDGPGAAIYSGIETQASITSNNGKEVGGAAIQNGSATQSLNRSFTESQQVNNNGTPKSLILINATRKAISHIDTNKSSSSTSRYAFSDSAQGTCGGTMTITFNLNDQTLDDFTGTMVFSNYCEGTGEGEATLSGSVSMEGQLSGTVTLTYGALTITAGGESFTTSGTVVTSYLAMEIGSFTATMDLHIRDNTSNKTFWLNNMEISVFINSDTYVEIDMLGKFYHPDFGYGNVSTPTPLRYAWSDQWPYQGTIIVTGATGTAGGNTEVKIVAISNTQYTYEIDADGNGSYDALPATLNWADLP